MNRKKRTPIPKRRRSCVRTNVARPARPGKKNLEDLPSALVLSLLLAGAAWAGWSGFILHAVGPDALRVSNQVPLDAWGLKGFFVMGFLAVMALAMLAGKALAMRCQSILVGRHLK